MAGPRLKRAEILTKFRNPQRFFHPQTSLPQIFADSQRRHGLDYTSSYLRDDPFLYDFSHLFHLQFSPLKFTNNPQLVSYSDKGKLSMTSALML